MKNLLVTMIVVCGICIFTITASASNYYHYQQKKVAVEQSNVNAACSKLIAFSPEAFNKIEQLMSQRGFVKLDRGLWKSCKFGFEMPVKSKEDFHSIIITWNGNVIQNISNGYGSIIATITLLEWKDIQ